MTSAREGQAGGGTTNKRAGPRSPRSRQKKKRAAQTNSSAQRKTRRSTFTGPAIFDGMARSSKRGRSCQMLTQRPAGGPSNARSFGRRGVRCRKARTPDFCRPRGGRACFATKVRRGRRKTAITGGRCEGPKSSKQKQQKKVFTATLRLFIADRERFRSLDLR